MGKASQAKKAAREARESGGGPQRPKRRLGYPLLIMAVVVLGVAAVWWARRPADTPSANLVTPEVQTVDPTASSTTVVAADAVPSSTTIAP